MLSADPKRLMAFPLVLDRRGHQVLPELVIVLVHVLLVFRRRTHGAVCVPPSGGLLDIEYQVLVSGIVGCFARVAVTASADGHHDPL